MVSKKRYVIVASAYDKRDRLIYSCTNSYNDSSSLMRYYANKMGQSKKVFNHAEIRCLEVAILKMRKNVDKLLVIRYDSNGSMKDACPCQLCKQAILDFNIKTVLYSTPEGMKELWA